MAESAAHFSALLKHVEPMLRENGFLRKRAIFYVTRGENVGLIEFQKSVKSRSDALVFTVNAGVYVSRIRRFLRGEMAEKWPELDDCHWRERIGSMLPSRNDMWWQVESDAAVDRVAEEVSAAITSTVIPQVRAYLDETTLRDLWLRGQSPGLTDMQRLTALSVLLMDIGPVERLAFVLDELRRQSEGKPNEAVVASHIQKVERERSIRSRRSTPARQMAK